MLPHGNIAIGYQSHMRAVVTVISKLTGFRVDSAGSRQVQTCCNQGRVLRKPDKTEGQTEYKQKISHKNHKAQIKILAYPGLV